MPAGVLKRRSMWTPVPIPTAICQGHTADARLDQASRREKIIVEQGARIAIAGWLGGAASVAIAHSWVLTLQVQGLDQPTRGQDIQSLIGEIVDLRLAPSRIDLSTQTIETCQQCLAVGDALQPRPLQDHVVQASGVGL